jgi:hypothetical protein
MRRNRFFVPTREFLGCAGQERIFIAAERHPDSLASGARHGPTDASVPGRSAIKPEPPRSHCRLGRCLLG